jgi:rhodanese-related sulfurtransferase/predicted transcriptional regulator
MINRSLEYARLASMTDREAKQALFDEFAKVGHALGSGRRVEIVDVLANGPRSVEVLAERVGLSIANTSQHLQVLRRAGLVSSSRDGTSVVYRLAGSEVFEFLRSLRSLAGDRVAGVADLAEDYLGADNDIERISRRELASRLKAGDDLVIVDVRPHEEFEAGHLPGALSIPVEELPRKLRHLPQGKDIVTYCRGPYCVFSNAAARLLRRRGFSVLMMDDGFPEWAADRLPLKAEVGGP